MLTKIVALLIVIGASLGAGAYIGKTYYPCPTCLPCTKDEPVVMRTNGGLLEVSTINATEIFTQAANPTIFKIPLPGRVVSQIQAEVTYRYNVELAPEWKFIRRDKTFVVIAPPIKPSLPVAVNLKSLKAQANGIWSPIVGNAYTQALQQTISASLATKATTQHYISLQRGHARKTVTEFVQKWVLSQDKWKDGNYTVQVFFADEPIDQIRANGYHPLPN